MFRLNSQAISKIWIVDQDVTARQALLQQVSSLGHQATGFENLMEARRIGGLQPDLVLLACDDLAAQSLASTQELLQLWPKARVVVVSSAATVPLAVATMRYGMHGLLEKPVQREMLQRELELLLARNAEETLADEQTQARQKLHALSARKQNILQLLVDGLPNKLIAARLNLGLRTVEKERAALFNALGVRCAAEAAVILVQANLRRDAATTNPLRGPTRQLENSVAF